jgi:hypothetical protein
LVQIDPKKIIWIPMRGSGDAAVPISHHTMWIFLAARIHFVRASGSGTDTATFTFTISDTTYTEFNWIAGTLTARGVSGDVNARTPYDELHAWTFRPQERLLCGWTNPDPVEVIWGGHALIYPVE